MHDLYTPFEDYQSQDYTDITFRPLILLTTGIERAKALADISRSPLYAFAVYKAKLTYKETRALIANPPNGAQLGAPPHIIPSYIRVRAVVWECGDGQTYRDTQTAVTNIYFTSSVTHAKCNNCRKNYLLLFKFNSAV